MGFKVSDVLGFINAALRGLWAMLCEAIYPGIASLYELFTNLGKLAYSDSFEAIYDKISLIIGIFMVFRVTFWLIEMLVNPDMITDKEKNPGKIVQKVLVSVILLAITPTIFKYAFEIQDEIVTEQIIEKIIIPDSNPADTTQSGRLIAAELFVNFYTPNENGDSSHFCYGDAGTGGKAYNDLISSGKLNISNNCLNERLDENDKYSEFRINFNGIFATAVGIVVFWMILMYCINLGSRYAELIFLQVVAPVPIMCYLTPNKDNMLSKWVKQCVTTYLDLFIRIAIISFVIFLSKMILANENNVIFNVFDSVQNGWMEVFLVLGLLMFAKKAPSLIQDLLPKGLTKASGDFGLSLKKRTDNMLGGKYLYGATSTVGRVIGKGGTVGVAGAAITGAVGFLGGRGTGRVTGAFGGMWRGFANGTKKGSVVKNLQTGIKQQQDVNKKKIDWANNDSSFGGRMQQRMANTFGLEGKAEKFDNDIVELEERINDKQTSIAPLRRKSTALKEVTTVKNNIEDRAKKRLLDKNLSDPEAIRLQNNVLTAQANLEYLQNNRTIMENGIERRVTAEDIRKAQVEYNKALDINSKEYITLNLQGKLKDIPMKSMFEHLSSAVLNDQEGTFDELEVTAKDENGNSYKLDKEKLAKLSSYDELDAFESEAVNKNNEITDGAEGIAAVERQIKNLEDEKQSIRTSEEYKKATADRNAVGGHQGGKK